MQFLRIERPTHSLIPASETGFLTDPGSEQAIQVCHFPKDASIPEALFSSRAPRNRVFESTVLGTTVAFSIKRIGHQRVHSEFAEQFNYMAIV